MPLWVMTTLSWCCWAWRVQLWGYSFLNGSAVLQWSTHWKSSHLFHFCCIQSLLSCHRFPPCFRLSVLETVTRYFQINLSLFSPCNLLILITMWSLALFVAVLLPTILRQRKNHLLLAGFRPSLPYSKWLWAFARKESQVTAFELPWCWHWL